MPLYRDEAVVLRTHKLGEADRIITLLTRQHGRVRAVAQGRAAYDVALGLAARAVHPRRPAARRGPQPRHRSPRPRRSTRSTPRLGLDYERYTAGTAMLETAERLVTEEKEPAVQQFLLLVGGLRAMAAGEHAAGQVLDSYLLRSLSVAGYAPSFDHCVGLRRRGAAPLLQPVRRRRAVHGRASCPGRPPRRRRPSALLGALLTGDWPVVHAAEPRHLREASTLVAAYLSWHLERGLRSMAYVER